MNGETAGAATTVLDPAALHRDPQERVKELTCLVTVSRAVGEALDAAAVCTITSAAVVLAMQRPALAVAVVGLGDEFRATDEIPGRHPCLEAKVLVQGRDHGQIRVAYKDGADDFLPEERRLLDALATMLGLWVEQRESRAALAESDARFRRLLTNIPDVVFRYRTGADEGLDYVSPSVEKLTGFTAEELLADSTMVREIVRPDLELSDQLTLVARDGSVRWVEHNVAAVHDRSGRLVAYEGIARDVTDKVSASHAVGQRASEQEALARIGQAALLSTGFDGLFDLAVELMKTVLSLDATAVYELSPDGRHLSMTHGTGWPEGVVGNGQLGLHECTAAASALSRGAPVVTAIVDDQYGGAPFLAAHGVVSALTVVIEGTDRQWGALGGYSRYRREYSTDEVQFLQTLGHILGAAVKRTNAEAALERSEREFRTLAEHLPDIVARFDRSHRYLYVNPRVETALGLAPADLIGRTNREVGVPKAPVLMWEDAAERVFLSGEPVSVEGVYPLKRGNVHLQSLLIPEFDRDGRVGTVVAVTRDLSDLRYAEEQRRESLARIVAAQEEERARIGEDIHDDSIQVMAAVGMRLEGLRRQITDPDTVILLGRLEEAVNHSISRLRNLMFDLRPPELDRDGLAAALRLHLEATSVGGLPLSELVDNCSRALPVAQRTVLYRIALEAITNVRKHANARRLEIILDEVDDGTRLRVRDDGRGFDTQQLAHVGSHHLGTRTMRERADVAGGKLAISSAPGEGTVVTAWLPSEVIDSGRS